MTDRIVVFNTCGTHDEARSVAHALVEARVAACVNIVPQVESVYRWQGKVERAQEWLLVIKTRRALLEKLMETLTSLHSYEVPEIIAVPVVDGLAVYLEWIGAETE
jgi:periplasmic divalent cation tolerance protein